MIRKSTADIDGANHSAIGYPSSLHLIITRPVIDSIPKRPIIRIETSNRGGLARVNLRAKRRVTPKVTRPEIVKIVHTPAGR